MMNSASNEKLAKQICEDFFNACDDQLEAKELEGDFLPAFLDIASSYENIVFPNFSADNVESVLFVWMPKKFTVDPDCAGDIIAELTIFFEYAKEKYQLKEGDHILSLLNRAGIEDDLREALADKSLYGMAKSMMMSAMEMGFDTTDPEEISEFVELHNQQLAQRLISNDTSALMEGPMARFDDPHPAQPWAPKSPQRSPAEQRKFNKDRRKALEKKKRK